MNEGSWAAKVKDLGGLLEGSLPQTKVLKLWLSFWLGRETKIIHCRKGSSETHFVSTGESAE